MQAQKRDILQNKQLRSSLHIAVNNNYRDWILQDIRKKYGYMLDQGATTFWETEKGWQDFDNAGSLCHGWSAMPIYYLRKLGTHYNRLDN